MKNLTDARMPPEESCAYCRLGAPDLCRCRKTTAASAVGIPASCRDEPKDRHQPTTPGEQGEEGA